MTVMLPKPPGVLEPGLAAVLHEMGPTVSTLEWRVADSPQGGGPVAAFDRLWGWAESGTWVAGRDLMEVVNQDIDVFGGEFFARRVGGQATAVTLRAIPKVRWDVQSDDPALVKALRAAFPGGVSLPKGGFTIPHGSVNARAKKERELALAADERARRPRRDNLDELLGGGPPAIEEE
jgi:hypothetical protein